MNDNFDRLPIRDQFRGVKFSFYKQDEIRKLSAKKITNALAFDHMNAPTAGGLHDKALGVSPFDNMSTCETCGLQQTKCPGHCGHIELTAPIYNPFLFKDAYRLLKAKCFNPECNKIRIHPSKVKAFVSGLKLLKAGQLVASGQLKQYEMNASKEVKIIDQNVLVDQTKLKAWNKEVHELLEKKSKHKVDHLDMQQEYSKLQAHFQDVKENYAEELDTLREKIISDANQCREDAKEQGADLRFEEFTSTIQKNLLDLTKEIWHAVVTTVCPSCKFKSPGIKKDGYTKLFTKPLAAKHLQVNQQRNRVSSAQAGDNDGMSEMGSERKTNASSKGSKHARSAAESLDIKENPEDEDSEESDEDEAANQQSATKQQYIRPDEVKRHLTLIWEEEFELLGLLYGRFDPSEEAEGNIETQGVESFFLNQVIVPPTRFRPESEGGHGGGSRGGVYLHMHSTMLTKIIQCNQNLSKAILDKQDKESAPVASETEEAKVRYQQGMNTLWIQLQDAVNSFVDASMAQKTVEQSKQGVRQLLERKEGMFRMKMMGKRVDFGGRSVISPDPNITTDEIGVPVFMARKLTFPESVANVNYERLATMVKNGPLQHPGANMVLDEQTGQTTLLSRMSEEQREGVANKLKIGNQVVYRHLMNGDPLLVNRQPTLHKPSIMAHLARVLPKEQTIRMHYANCKTYNADFDGDEMNIHLVQSYEARSEALNIMATHKQFVVPTDGNPLRGLIQDSVISGVCLSNKDCFLEKDDYMQLVYAGLRQQLDEGTLSKVHILTPAMIKPKIRWTGKQVVSTILKNIVRSGGMYKDNCGMNVDSKSKLSAKEWGPIGKEEGEVIIRDNEHLQGTLDKNQFGATNQGMVHCFYEIYGSKKAGELLTALTRIFHIYLQARGHTVGIDDLVLTKEANKERRMNIEEGHFKGVLTAAKWADAKDFAVKKLNYSSRVVFASEARKDKDIEKFTNMILPENPFKDKKCIQQDDKILSKLESKIGQNANADDKEVFDVELDGVMRGCMSGVTSKILADCIPSGLVKKFPKNNISAMVLTGAKGGVVNQTQISALLGQQELEGRRVPKMQNGKTLPSFLAYDPNPRANGYVSDRFITGLRPQDFFFHCMAGREGLIDTAVKTSRSGYLQRCLIKQLESLVVKYDMTVRDSDNSIVSFMYGDDGVDVMHNRFLEKFKFMEANYRSLPNKAEELIKKGIVQEKPVRRAKEKFHKAEAKIAKKNPKLTGYEVANLTADPVLSMYDPKRHIGAISELMENKLNEYVAKELNQKHNVLDAISSSKKPKMKFASVDADDFKKMYYHKYLRSIIEPGENVGTIAAQSVGEPSTQMTLNTFHLAGHGGANMTLGIPRLKEILMTTPTNVKTPCMKIFFHKNNKLSQTYMKNLALSYERLSMADVVQQVHLAQEVGMGNDGKISRLYKITLEFEDPKMLKEKLGIKFESLAQYFGDKFVPRLMHETMMMIRKSAMMDATADGGNANLIKKQIGVSANLTKVTRGTEVKKDEDEDGVEGDVPAHESEEDEDERANEEMGETDGTKKQNVNKYANASDASDDDKADADSDSEPSLANGDESQDNEETAAQPEQKEVKAKKAPAKAMSAAENAMIKYREFIKGDYIYEEGTSATVTLTFPIEYKKLLLMTIVETVMQQIKVKNVPGIERVHLNMKDTKGQENPHFFVQGINFRKFEQNPDIFDLTKTETNHSYELKNRYGIEACRANIVKEIREVFGVYGIDVNYRHLSLIGDFITFNGDYRAFNRVGMEECSSPFLKMSFETTMKYLVSSATQQDTDWLTSPSSAIVVGQAPAVGSNTFDVMQDSF